MRGTGHHHADSAAALREPLLGPSFNPARKYRPYIEAARQSGVDVERCLARVGLSVHRALDPSLRISRESAIALCVSLIESAKDPELGLRAAECSRSGDSDLCYLMRYASNLREACTILERYARLNGDAIECAAEQRSQRIVLSLWLAGGRVLLPETADWTFGALLLTLRACTAGRAIPLQVELPRPVPQDPDRYRRFFGAPVAFGVERGALHYAVADAGIPFVDSDPRLLTLLLQQADQVLAQTSPATLRERIAAILVRELEHGEPSMPALARDLAMSERTLRRRLQETGYNYRDILEHVRRERALTLARDGRANVTSIAHRVGFDDLTAFGRAFRRWTGESPSAYLKARRIQRDVE